MKCLLAVLLLLLAVSMGQVAFAGAILELTDGTNSVTLDTSGNLITSGSVSTVIYSGVPGELTWDGTLGAWNVSVTTGLGSPLEPAATLDIDSVDVSTGSSDLQILLSQNNNTLNIAGNMAWSLNFGGTLASGRALL